MVIAELIEQMLWLNEIKWNIDGSSFGSKWTALYIFWGKYSVIVTKLGERLLIS